MLQMLSDLLSTELSSLLINMRQEAWSATAGALRTALRNWARFSPMEAHDIIAEKIRFDGTTERLFDQFIDLSKKDPSHKFSLWPVLVPLLAVSPDRLVVISSASYERVAQRVMSIPMIGIFVFLICDLQTVEFLEHDVVRPYASSYVSN